jgi:type I restriction enzyme S subunit
MVVPTGYKLTQIGVIPEDWQVHRLRDFATVATGTTPSTFVPQNYGGKYLFVTPADLGRTKYIRRTEKTLSEKGFAVSRRFPEASVLFVCIGATIGKCGIASTALTSNQQINAIFPSSIVLPEYLYYGLSAAAPRIRLLAGEQAVPLINKSQFSETEIPLPTLAEQRAISSALGEVDELLETLEKLIAKKHDLQQAAMQQLLTGRVRLPGFQGDWEEAHLGDIGEISGAGVDKKIRPNETAVRLLNYMDVYKKDFLRASDALQRVTAQPDQIRRCTIKKGDIFFTPTSELRGDIANAAVALDEIPGAVYSYHLVRLRLSMNWDLRFRVYPFKAKYFLDQAATQCEGSGTRYVITLPRFRSMTVRFPKDVQEQSAIADVLFDIDNELILLQDLVNKTRSLKQAMMQELLTGKTRLVAPEPTDA